MRGSDWDEQNYEGGVESRFRRDAGTNAANPLAPLRTWLDDPNRKPPHLAFTAGPEREVADRITTMIADSLAAALDAYAKGGAK